MDKIQDTFNLFERLLHSLQYYIHLHLADTFIQSDLEAIKINKRAICKCDNKSQLAIDYS